MSQPSSWLATLAQTLLDPLQWDFMQTALVMALVVAVPAALLSCFLVVKGWALLGDAITHAVFPGIVLAHMLGLPYAAGAFAAGIFCATATGYLHANSRIKQDTLMGIVFSGMFAAGLLLHAAVPSTLDLHHILFGNVLAAQWADVAKAAAFALLVAGWVALQWRSLMLYAFDPVQAHTTGLHTRWLHYGLLIAVSLTVVTALQTVGIVLAIALLIAPGATAFLLTRTLNRMLLLACTLACANATLGVYLSFFLNSAPAPTIVLLHTACFALALWRSPRQPSAGTPARKQPALQRR